MLSVLNILFFVFHTGLIVFNLFGWMAAKTRRWNFVALLATLFSWLVMGAWKGIGYCLCTDWHWQVRHAMGIQDDQGTYVGLLLTKLTGVIFSPASVFWVTLTAFTLAFAASVYMNLRDWMRMGAVKR